MWEILHNKQPPRNVKDPPLSKGSFHVTRTRSCRFRSPSGGLPGFDSTNLRWLWLYTIWIIQKKKKKNDQSDLIHPSKGNQSKNSGLTWCWTHVNLRFASMAAHAVRVSRNCFNLSSSRFHFFSIWKLQRLSLSFWSYISLDKLQLFQFPTFSRCIFFWLPDQGRLRISRYCGNHLRLMFINPTPHFSCRKSKGINLPHHPHSIQVILPSATPRDVLNHHHPAGCLLKDWGVRTSTHHRFGRHSKTIGSTFCQIPQATRAVECRKCWGEEHPLAVIDGIVLD